MGKAGARHAVEGPGHQSGARNFERHARFPRPGLHPVFGIHVPTSCPGVSPEVLQARATWSDPSDYDRTAKKLAEIG